MSEPKYHVRTIAFSYDERSDWAIQRYLNTEAEADNLLDRIILTDRGDKDQAYKHRVIITKLVESDAFRTNPAQPNHALGEAPSVS
ncbi:MAG: hypothetical protein IIC33_07555 [Chloroflexi bacterium]|nr:hypothetical protein [Chloroflexota bacterium]